MDGFCGWTGRWAVALAMVCFGCGDDDSDDGDSEANRFNRGGGAGAGTQERGGVYQGPGDTVPQPPPQTPDLMGTSCAPQGSVAAAEMAIGDPDCLLCSGTPPSGEEEYLTYSQRVTLGPLIGDVMSGRLTPDANGCVYHRFTLDNVKQLDISMSNWFNGQLSANPGTAGLPLGVRAKHCDAEVLFLSLDERVTSTRREPIPDPCSCVEVTVGLDAVTAAQWLMALEGGDSEVRVSRENYVWDIGVETCTPCDE